MKKLLVLVTALVLIGSVAFALEPIGKIPQHGSGNSLLGLSTVELTDAAPTYNAIVLTRDFQSVMVDVVSDKGGTLVIYPIPNSNDATVFGLVSDTLTVADGGPSDRGGYSNIAAPKAKILFTKTEAGTTSGFLIAVRGVLD